MIVTFLAEKAANKKMHRSRLPRGVALQVGDVIAVIVAEIDPERGRNGLGWQG